MRVALLLAPLTLVAFLSGCSPGEKSTSGERGAGPAATNQAAASQPDDLLLRVTFAGTAAAATNPELAYFTNFSALPETAALRDRIVERFAGLPGRWFNASPSTNLQAVFADVLQAGFALELCGPSNVTRFALAARGDAATLARWSESLSLAAQGWSSNAPVKTAQGWTAANGAVRFTVTNGMMCCTVSRPAGVPVSPLPSGMPSADFLSSKLLTGSTSNILEAELSSALLPNPIRRSVYGGFERFRVVAAPSGRSLLIRGVASYATDLPVLPPPPEVPAELVTEPAISFTLVRLPEKWLTPDNPLRRFLPEPMPDTMFFWGGESSPYQFFAAMPFNGRGDFTTNYGPWLVTNLGKLSQQMDCGQVLLDAAQRKLQWGGVPFLTPRLTQKKAGTNDFLVAEVFPASQVAPGLTPALLERVSGRTNVVLYDWEFSQMRIDTWFRLGQLALLVANCQQLGGQTASLRWILAAQAALEGGGNTFTEVLQTSPHELALTRRAPLAFTSLELFWLGNWLESSNFPAANFLVPVPAGTGWNLYATNAAPAAP